MTVWEQMPSVALEVPVVFSVWVAVEVEVEASLLRRLNLLGTLIGPTLAVLVGSCHEGTQPGYGGTNDFRQSSVPL